MPPETTAQPEKDKVREQMLMLQARLKAFCAIEYQKHIYGLSAEAEAAQAFERGLNAEERQILLRLGIFTLLAGKV